MWREDLFHSYTFPPESQLDSERLGTTDRNMVVSGPLGSLRALARRFDRMDFEREILSKLQKSAGARLRGHGHRHLQWHEAPQRGFSA
jgi:hypothetical protein